VERADQAQPQESLKAAPESFEESDSAGGADGAEALANAEAAKGGTKVVGGELSAAIRDEMSRKAVGGNGASEQSGDRAGAGNGEKESISQGESGEGIEDNGQLEVEESKEAWDLG